ncbi:glycoside hydrolase family 127 protein [Salibacterium aidingense]|uniref:glycoside hydrolase family 127 protein n=1 Tax=Salibacterium aidingense TaxID=384933 RepID=UPI003BDA4B23
MTQMTALPLSNIQLKDQFWKKRQELVRDSVIPYQWNTLNDNIPGVEPSHTLENFRVAAGLSNHSYYGMVFQDSDLYKWLETASYSLSITREEGLEQKTDEAVAVIEAAQEADGYLHTYHQCVHPDRKWTNLRDDHELYCAGHLIEAAVGYFEATGKNQLLKVACRLVDLIAEVFGPEKEKRRGYPGHPEIELALLKLYKTTENKKYLNLCKFFVNERGREPHYFEWEAEEREEKKRKEHSYSQSHLPIREQTSIEGHAVRAVYLYSAAAELAAECKDEELAAACKRLWENMVLKRMYITGGIGSSHYHESFTFDYDLPNDRAYTETCASVGLVFWAWRMIMIDADSSYADAMERTIYNGLISGMSLDGTKYFYVNPLEVWPEAVQKRNDLSDTEVTRQGWFVCACCPPNIARFLSSFGQYMFTLNEKAKELYVHLYAGSETNLTINNQPITLTQTTDYPWKDTVSFKIDSEKEGVEWTLALRLPGWCQDPNIQINGEVVILKEVTEKGYAKLKRAWHTGDEIVLTLPMKLHFLRADTRLRENTGKVALQRGPIVYCVEEADNGRNLQEILVSDETSLQAEYEELLDGMVILHGRAYRETMPLSSELYTTRKPEQVTVDLKAIPYYAWANREPGEMRIWLREACR